MDDLQYNPGYWDQVPPDVAWWVQIWLVLENYTLRLEHEGATSWVYSNSRPWDVYRLWGQSLGAEPDAMTNQLFLVRHISSGWDVHFRVLDRFKGANTLDTPNPRVGEYPDKWFLMQPVEHTDMFYLGASWVSRPGWVRAEIGYGSWPAATLSAGVLIWP